MQPIRNILFDLGNVIIDLDIPATETALREILGGRELASFTRNEQHGLFREYELGLLSEAEFFDRFRELAGHPLADEEIRRVWNALLAGIPRQRLDMLRTLRKNYGVYLLSNTNFTHLQWVYRYLETEHGITDFDTRFFDRPYYSHEIHHRKPDRTVYEFVLQHANIRPEETLFIDDNAANIAGAAAVGLQTLHHPEGEVAEILPPFLRR